MPDEIRVLCVQEAGRDGFSVHRFLEHSGYESLVVDSSSIEVPRKSRRVKTDRVDANSMLRMLRRYAGGERKVWRVLHVPSPSQEECRRLHRELSRLKKERTSLTNRMRSILVTHGIHWTGAIKADFLVRLSAARCWDGGAVPETTITELGRAARRWSLIEEQISEIEKGRRRTLRRDRGDSEDRVRRLTRLKGIGETSAWVLGDEFFWRKFSSRREVGSAAGLVGSPYQSGTKNQEQGISKAGNKRVRSLMVELSWDWLQWQPGSALSRWFEERFGQGSKRMRRVGIVALARKLLVALWRYLEEGLVPDGAVIP
jgi:transposase